MKLGITAVMVGVMALAGFPGLVHASSHAVIIQGWTPEEAASHRGGDTLRDELWQDCFLMYEMLYNRPVIARDTNRLHMLWGKSADYTRTGWRYDPLRIDTALKHLTGDSATLSTVGNTFAQLADTMGHDDSLFCYTWGHGGRDESTKTHFSVEVRPVTQQGIYFHGTDLWDTTLARMANVLPCKRVFIMQQCYGGGFMDDLTDSNTVMVCAAAANKKARSADGWYKHNSPCPECESTGTQMDSVWRHCEFNFHFMNALRGKTIWGRPNGYQSPESVYADANHDGVISWREAYDYTKYYDSQEDPVFFGEDSFWSVLPDVPDWASNRRVNAGGALATELTDKTLIYAFKGNNTRDFYAYDPAKDSWLERDTIPSSGSTGTHKVSMGASLVSAGNGVFYATKGKCLEFWKYDDSIKVGSKWAEMPNVPAGPSDKSPKDGASAVAALYHDTTCVYLLKGNNTREFYRFNTKRGQWDVTALSQPPDADGKKFKRSCLAFDGFDTIYALKGVRKSTTSYFPLYAYSVSGDSWVSKPGLPLTSTKTSLKGSTMAFCGENLYAVKGSGLETWVLRRTDATWHKMQSMPTGQSNKKVGYGGAMASDGTVIWALKGGNTHEFFRFMPNRCSGEQYSEPQPPSPGGNESCLAADGDAEDVRWCNGGDWVAFTALDDNNHRQVFKVSSDSGAPIQLTSLNGECSRPVWSPGDTSIAFEVTPDSTGYSQIAVVPGDSGAVMYLTTSSWDHWYATWSPSGLVGYLCEDSTGYPQVHVKLSTGETHMTQAAVEHESPEFASATVMTFAREGINGYTEVYKTTLNSQTETPITSSSADHANPVPAAGSKVFYEVDDAYGYTQVAKVLLQGGAEQVLTSGSYDFESPTVNASGGLIFCTKSDGPGSSVCQVSPTGGYTELTDDDAERAMPHALLNGTTSIAAAYVRDGDVFRLTAGGDGQQTAGLFPFALEGAKPNPGRARIIIRWQLPAEARASLRVYNAAGQLVKVLADGMTKPGAYTSIWNGTDMRGRRLANGVYFYALDNGAKRISRKLVLTE